MINPPNYEKKINFAFGIRECGGGIFEIDHLRMKNYVIAIDQGTTSCRAILFNAGMKVAGIAQKT
ncbi:MAG TPA: hypothetical protein ENJ82_03805, partial [Bacteroidetes bacterium]|nr:hypothetical protein [Bacteroidota bacterium]